MISECPLSHLFTLNSMKKLVEVPKVPNLYNTYRRIHRLNYEGTERIIAPCTLILEDGRIFYDRHYVKPHKLSLNRPFDSLHYLHSTFSNFEEAYRFIQHDIEQRQNKLSEKIEITDKSE